MMGFQNAPLLALIFQTGKLSPRNGNSSPHVSLEDAAQRASGTPGTAVPTGTHCFGTALKSGAKDGRAL